MSLTVLESPGRSVARLAADHPARLSERTPIPQMPRHQDAVVYDLVNPDADFSIDAPAPVRVARHGNPVLRGARAVALVGVGMAAGFSIVGVASLFAAASAVAAVLVF